ncbi:MAG: CBS domain-containing protein [Phycisphaeraceae bacterium]|nr:CBS domain-containing protein [Phycisphaerales bacterium]MCB9859379.1 CBS domain-containing protein [Phycisphaeraceae bacterium]
MADTSTPKPTSLQDNSHPQRAGDIMTEHVVTVSMDDSLREIREVFTRFRFRHVPVVEDGVLVGIISDRDVLSHVSPFVGSFSERAQDANSLKLKAHQVMTREPMIGDVSTPIVEIGMLMLQYSVSCIPICDEAGICVGIVTSRDVLRWCLRSGCGVKQAPSKTKQPTDNTPTAPKPDEKKSAA